MLLIFSVLVHPFFLVGMMKVMSGKHILKHSIPVTLTNDGYFMTIGSLIRLASWDERNTISTEMRDPSILVVLYLPWFQRIPLFHVEIVSST